MILSLRWLYTNEKMIIIICEELTNRTLYLEEVLDHISAVFRSLHQSTDFENSAAALGNTG